MYTYTSTQIRTKISEALDTTPQREPIEIPHQYSSSAVVINKAQFEAYKNAKLDAEFDMIMQPHGHTVEALTNR